MGTLCSVQQSGFSPSLMLIGRIYTFLISDHYLNVALSVIQV